MYTISNAAGLEAARVGFHAGFLEQLGLIASNPLEQLFTEVQSNASVEEWDWMGDLPDFEEWKGDRKLAALAAYRLTVRNKDWSSGLKLHQNDISDDRLGIVKPKVAGLAQMAAGHPSRLMMKLLVNGFAGNAFPDVGNGLGYDGAFYFSTAHTTGSNKLTTALSQSSLETAELMLQSQTSYDLVQRLAIRGTHLIVGPKLAPIANQLMKMDLVANGAGTAGITNYLKGRYQIIESPLLSGAYDDYWFLADLTQPYKPMMFQKREGITTSAIVGQKGGTDDSLPRFQRGEIWFGAEARYNVAYLEHRTIVGSIVA